MDNLRSVINQSLSPIHTAGPDGVSSFAVITALPILIPLLVQLFNALFDLAHFPSVWKRGHIRPLLKNNPPTALSDCRPIASLPELSKLLEHIAHNQITSFVSSNNFLDPRQSGFRKSYSSQTALLRICQDIRQAVDQRKVTLLVLFDFGKAFDLVPHHILLSKLRSLGFGDRALHWCHSYLTGRSQAATDRNGHSSDWLTISTTTGVPQGSVLGPLLFPLFLYDIGDSLMHSQHLVFANDLQIYLSCLPSVLPEAIARITIDVAAIVRFADRNGLKLNLLKSNILILGSGTFINRIDLEQLPSIKVDGVTLPYVNNARNLEVTMSANLSWSKHTLSISKRVHFTLYKLKYRRHILSRKLRTILVSSLIFPTIDYCCFVFNDITDEQDLILQRLVNCAIRFIFDFRRNVHITP